jgi:basic amino acid/polyamine antiporter, APA family
VKLSEETKNPGKTIPRAIILSLLISTALYILVSLAAVALMSPEELGQTESALSDAALKSSPKIASALGGIALFSTANTALIALVTTSRILYGLGKDNSLPQIFSRTLPKRKTPLVGALAVLAISGSLLPLGKVDIVASVSSFATMIAFIGVNMALIGLRLSSPKKERPFKVPLAIGWVPILPVFGIATSILFLFQFSLQIYFIGIIAILCAISLYFLHMRAGRGLG